MFPNCFGTESITFTSFSHVIITYGFADRSIVLIVSPFYRDVRSGLVVSQMTDLVAEMPV